MVDFIIQYWLQIVFGLILTALTAGYKYLKQQIDERVEQHKAIRKAVLALLRQYIYDSYNNGQREATVLFMQWKYVREFTSSIMLWVVMMWEQSFMKD